MAATFLPSWGQTTVELGRAREMEMQPPPNSLLLSQEFLLFATGGLLTDAEGQMYSSLLQRLELRPKAYLMGKKYQR